MHARVQRCVQKYLGWRYSWQNTANVKCRQHGGWRRCLKRDACSRRWKLGCTSQQGCVSKHCADQGPRHNKHTAWPHGCGVLPTGRAEQGGEGIQERRGLRSSGSLFPEPSTQGETPGPRELIKGIGNAYSRNAVKGSGSTMGTYRSLLGVVLPPPPTVLTREAAGQATGASTAPTAGADLPGSDPRRSVTSQVGRGKTKARRHGNGSANTHTRGEQPLKLCEEPPRPTG